jgi:hypothetical protein
MLAIVVTCPQLSKTITFNFEKQMAKSSWHVTEASLISKLRVSAHMSAISPSITYVTPLLSRIYTVLSAHEPTTLYVVIHVLRS